MTEAEWLTAKHPGPMLAYVTAAASKRKLRLFACAECRRLSRSLVAALAEALEAAEGYADGTAPRRRMLAISARFAVERATRRWVTNRVERLIRLLLRPEVDAQWVARLTVARSRGHRWQVGILRDFFGNPFRPVALDPRWRTETVVSLAETIYAERAFDRLPILADALQDAGCEDADVLGHCRGPGPHARGCWVVDLVLGKG